MTTDLDALIAEAREMDAVDMYETRNWAEDAEGLADRLADALESTLAELRQERERASDLEGAYNSAVERHRLAAEKRDEYQQLYGDMADDERRARAALSRAEETIEKAHTPTDMQVTVALQEFYGDSSSTDFDRATEDSMRAALRAAGEARGEGR